MEIVTLKSKTTHECSNSKTVKSNIYLTILSINNDTTSDNFINTTYEVYVLSIENDWEDYAIKYGKESLNINQKRYRKTDSKATYT